ncbi:LamG domain protein [Candidatus Mancarchaeum acidiphilum]|uniref:LamG domain protein n=1 Tax=Candidatus Mancarchaeum acidiphilum TaxID=1920749 RepID=A0A218NM08_9ARCH|nr:LamG domain-containing protein [Candidatus Mancarchaeum acidiphilum]ASI13510.1 LamG domain protein [Candidatus Mancarchaeum acidiphilum]
MGLNRFNGKNKKGILLTLLMIIVLILMMAELITYVTLNISYDDLSSSAVSTGSSSAMVKTISPAISSFLKLSLKNSVSVLVNYESDPKLRGNNFVINTKSDIIDLMDNQSLYGIDYRNAIGMDISDYLNLLESKASADGVDLEIENGTLNVYQSNSTDLEAEYTAVAILNNSGLLSYYPIVAVANVSLEGMPDLHSVQNANFNNLVIPLNFTLYTLGNSSYALSGFTYMSPTLPGTLYYFTKPTCQSIPSSIQNGNYILLANNASGINGSVCGMAGLVANVTNTTGISKPYLVYPNSTINLLSKYSNSGSTKVILGPNPALYNYTALKNYIADGYYFKSNDSEDYLQEGEYNPDTTSNYGLVSFNSYSRQVAEFDGVNSDANISSFGPELVSNITISAWINNNGKGNYSQNIADVNGKIINEPNGLFYIGVKGKDGKAIVGWSNIANIFKYNSSGGVIAPNNWYFITGVWNKVTGNLSLYVNGKLVNTTQIAFPPPLTPSISINEINIAGKMIVGSDQLVMNNFNGSIANVQIYNKSLSPASVEYLYYQGLDGRPLNDYGLIAWYPLNGNAFNYYNYSYNLTQSNMAYTNYISYTESN